MSTPQIIESVTQIVTALAAVGATVGLWLVYQQAQAALDQVKLLKQQLDDTRRWNKMSMAITHMPSSHELSALEADLNSSFLRLIDRNDPLSDAELNQLDHADNNRLRIQLKNYFNMIEAYCSAVNHGIVDTHVAHSIYGYKFKRHFIEFLPYITRFRARATPNFMAELESVLKTWFPTTETKTKY